MANEQQLWAAFDALQNRQQELEARLDSLCTQMNGFCQEVCLKLEALGFVQNTLSGDKN